MDLIFWRHAEAEDCKPDLARQLTTHGTEQAAKMAAWLQPRLPANISILVSPAVRAQQTARALTSQFTTLNALAPGASAAHLLAAVNWPDIRQPVLVIGHQPTIGQAISQALTGRAEYWNVEQSALWWLTSHSRHLHRQVQLRTVITPEQLP